MPVANRFQIEDIKVQDHSGVVFRATDTETGQPVAIRRFFPFGPAGGGLNETEQAEYQVALGHLAVIRHPALRAIITGGCDGVDGMPFIATEWIEGDTLEALLLHRPLNEREAKAFINLAISACEELSQIIGLDGVWIETDPNTIILGAEGTDRPFIFWIAPLKWLGGAGGKRGLGPLVKLTESIMGWVGVPASSLPASGIGTWLKWLHGAAATSGLCEARERLAASNSHAPTAARPTVRQATGPVHHTKRPAKARSKVPAWILGCTALLALGGGGWMLAKRNDTLEAAVSGPLEIFVRKKVEEIPRHVASSGDADEPETAMVEVTSSSDGDGDGEKSVAETNREIAERMAEVRKESEAQDARNAEAEEKLKARGGVLEASDRDLLLARKERHVEVEGVFDSTSVSKDKVIYITFPSDGVDGSFIGKVYSADAKGQLSRSALDDLKGKRIRLRGTIRTDGKKSAPRPYIRIESRNEIKVIE